MSIKKIKNFIPFSKEDFDKYLAAIPSSQNQDIRGYKVSSWYNTKSHSILYGIACQLKENKDWFYICDDKRPVVFDDKKLANKACRELKKTLILAAA